MAPRNIQKSQLIKYFAGPYRSKVQVYTIFIVLIVC